MSKPFFKKKSTVVWRILRATYLLTFLLVWQISLVSIYIYPHLRFEELVLEFLLLFKMVVFNSKLPESLRLQKKIGLGLSR